MPANLEPGILYVAQEFGAAAHLCACGCGAIVRTPLNRWSLTETKKGPSLEPSIGNWQEPCQSHYWIDRGDVRWAEKWTPEEITAGRQREGERLDAYFDAHDRRPAGAVRRFWHWIQSFF